MKKTLFTLKRILILSLLLTNFVNAQTVSTAYATQINATFANLDKTRIPHKLLVDYAMEFTELSGYNGVLTDTTYIDSNIMGDIYKTIFMSKVVN